MRMTVIAAAAFLGLSSSALADCAPMIIKNLPDADHIFFGDLDGSGGISPGDKRSGEGPIIHEDGKPAGTIFWANTILATDDDGNATKIENDTIFAFKDGSVFVTSVMEPATAAAADDTEVTVIKPVHEFQIHGGTRVYDGASGTVASTSERQAFTFTFDLTRE